MIQEDPGLFWQALLATIGFLSHVNVSAPHFTDCSQSPRNGRLRAARCLPRIQQCDNDAADDDDEEPHYGA